MKQFAFILLSLCAFTIDSFAQNNARDSIIMTGTPMGGLRYYEGGKKTNLGTIAEKLSRNPEAFRYIQKARTDNVFSFLFAFAGGFIIGWEIGSSIGGKQPSWPAIGAGVGCIGLSIPFAIGVKRNAKKALDLYNSSLR